MQKVDKITTKNVLDLDKYVNTSTAETLKSEAGVNSTAVVTTSTDMVTITSDDFAVIDVEAFMIIAQILNKPDLANVLKMAVVTKTPLNIVFNGNVPHTNETLQKYLALKSEAMYMNLIRRLIKAGILYQIKGQIYGEVRVCYMLNPYLTRKRKTFEERVLSVFQKFTESQTLLGEL